MTGLCSTDIPGEMVFAFANIHFRAANHANSETFADVLCIRGTAKTIRLSNNTLGIGRIQRVEEMKIQLGKTTTGTTL